MNALAALLAIGFVCGAAEDEHHAPPEAAEIPKALAEEMVQHLKTLSEANGYLADELRKAEKRIRQLQAATNCA